MYELLEVEDWAVARIVEYSRVGYVEGGWDGVE